MGPSKIYHRQPGLGLVYKTIPGFSMDFIHWKYSGGFYDLSDWAVPVMWRLCEIDPRILSAGMI